MHKTENGIQYTYLKMAENAHPDNDRIKNIQLGKEQNRKCRTQKMSENMHTRKWQKMHTLKMTEQKMHDTENGRK